MKTARQRADGNNVGMVIASAARDDGVLRAVLKANRAHATYRHAYRDDDDDS